MYEYEIVNRNTNEEEMIFGYNLQDAFRRTPSLIPTDWAILSATYAD